MMGILSNFHEHFLARGEALPVVVHNAIIFIRTRALLMYMRTKGYLAEAVHITPIREIGL